MTAMPAVRVHNTTPGPLRVAGTVVPSGRSAVVDVELDQLPAGAYVNRKASEQEVALAGPPSADRPVDEVVAAIDLELDPERVAELAAGASPRSRIGKAAAARLEYLATLTPTDPPADEAGATEEHTTA